jgi:hypothetical protein
LRSFSDASAEEGAIFEEESERYRAMRVDRVLVHLRLLDEEHAVVACP